MERFLYNTHRPYLCIDCGAPVGRRVMRCPECAAIALANRGATYERNPDHNRLMSVRTKGIKRNYPSASTRPEVAEKIRQSWTPEKREAARQRMVDLMQNHPEKRLQFGSPGDKNLMWENGRTQIPYGRGWTRAWKLQAWQRADYHCEICGSDNPCDTHHKDFSKSNHHLENLQVLCRKCHKRLHADHLKNKNHPY